MLDRRQLVTAGLAALGLTACPITLEHGFWNPCDRPLPERLRRHDLIQRAFEGLAPEEVWDCHAHLVGVGDSGPGTWINPAMNSWAHPFRSFQKAIYMNAACAEVEENLDGAYVQRLLALMSDFPTGAKIMLMAFDYHHDATGKLDKEASTFYTDNDYTRAIAARFPHRFEWTASIHPYREDAVERLAKAVAGGARALKWLPPSMGIDPDDKRCDVFYEALAKSKLPLITHAGKEQAVESPGSADNGNPLRLKRALDHGVRVIVAHCSSLGDNVDLDVGREGPEVNSFGLFERLMEDHRYDDLLFGDISATTQSNRVGRPLLTLLRRKEWHPRLLNGSDYPLPGVYPLFSLSSFESLGLITRPEAFVLGQLRDYNALLFDFVLKRTLRLDGAGFGPQVFETRRVFASS